MIIKGKSRSGPSGLAKHLGNAETNERITLLETRGTVADDLRGALIEMDALAAGTRCEKPLYHAAISPGPQYLLTPEQRKEAIDALEAKLGFEGHARTVVLHEKLGRQHFHVVWSRIDLEHMRSVSDSHNYRKHEEVARDLERRFGHERVQGAHHERDGVERPDRTPSRAELRQEERTGIRGKDVKAEVSLLFRASDNAEAFKTALEDAGYVLAQGDRRDFVIVDHAGGIHSLARRINGMRAVNLREFMSPIDREALPSIEEAKVIALQREHDRAEDRKEKNYSRGADYASQSRTALKDHIERQKKLDRNADGIRMFDYADPEQTDEKRRQTEENKKTAKPAEPKASPEPEINGEMSDAKRARFERLMNTIREEDKSLNSEEPDRQHEAPGGGRTRSR